uniref:NADH:ubiquinone reductase (H(+)-translocating) n=1 Tax=Phyxioschema suthepium TaxID=1155482 RepID=L7NWN4_9ARAC|nr:NADH dehydrogenase subunit 5 [Phyxioschema suthepium]AFC77863.1 NADH dehydrogenase subunit 5 [Phyxioschema suthepium]
MILMSFILLLLAFTLFSLSFILMFFNSQLFLFFPIIPFCSSILQISILIDWISSLFSASVLFISSFILIFSTYYIPSKEQKRFSLILLSFIISMIILIFSNNLFFMILGWDGLGVSSYILVVYYRNLESSKSGMITILSNRIGDIMIIISVSFLSSFGLWEFNFNSLFPFLILILLILAAFTKSAQAPFSAWLPAAMAAPTPVSALVHSSTLVTAGIFLLIRIFPLSHPLSSTTVMFLSLITMIFASISANWEQDLKKIIALSTLSQIALMAFSISINCPSLAFFHLITHAFFKSTLFLCAGTLIHNSSYQDLRSQGASFLNNPIILILFNTANMALMGIPFMAGFYSKDMIIESSILFSPNLLVFFLSYLSIGLTASYSSRLLSLSSKLILKHNKNKSFIINLPVIFSIIPLIPLSILSGALISWLSLPSQLLITPLSMKIMILTSVSLGFLLGSFLSFKSSLFLKLGHSSISLWFLYSISPFLPINSSKMGHLASLVDKSWLEFHSVNQTFLFLKNMSYLPLSNSFLNLIPIMIFLIPLSIFFYL